METDIKRDALKIFKHALKAVMPEVLMQEFIRLYANELKNEFYLFGAGKASGKMAEEFLNRCGKVCLGGVVSSVYEGSAANVDIIRASHPNPDKNSLEAGKRIYEWLSKLSEEDFFVFMLSGGASALMEYPQPPITLEEFKKTNELLLLSGADIFEVNCVRKHISLVKGGKLAKITKAKGIVVVISDVIGDDLSVIGSAPFYCDKTTFKDAKEVLLKRKIWEKVPQSVRQVINEGIEGKLPETLKEPPENIKHVIIGNNLKALKAAEGAAKKSGFNTIILTSRLSGEAREVAKVLTGVAMNVKKDDFPIKKPSCVIAGGETTVTVRGKGRGGRNQELVLAALKQIKETQGIAVLSAGTDGIDGNSDAAGAVADYKIYQRAKELGLSIDRFLSNNDSNSFFKKTGGLINTGWTNTNVMDIVLLLIV